MPLANLAELMDSFRKNPVDGGREILIPEFLPLLDAALPEHTAWLRRSLNSVVLLAHADWHTPWFVRVAPAIEVEPYYQIDFLLPAPEAPWPDARVSGIAHSKERAAEMTRIALLRCGGWA